MPTWETSNRRGLRLVLRSLRCGDRAMRLEQEGYIMIGSVHPRSTGYAIRHPDRFFAGGEWHAPEAGRSLNVISPSDEQVAAQVAAGGSADIDKAVSAARDAFDRGPWPRTSAKDRADALRRIAAKLRDRLPETAWASTLEMGGPLATTLAVGARAIGLFDEYADLLENYPIED